MKISEIKKHNKNIENIILFINETENLKDYVYYEDWGYIDSIKKIFNAKKEIAKCYNNIVKNYNSIVKNINSINFQIEHHYYDYLKNLIKECYYLINYLS